MEILLSWFRSKSINIKYVKPTPPVLLSFSSWRNDDKINHKIKDINVKESNELLWLEFLGELNGELKEFFESFDVNVSTLPIMVSGGGGEGGCV